MKTRKDKIISFTLSDELLKMLDKAVQDSKTNRSHILRMCIRQTLGSAENNKEDI
jgi:metal-responsive CopG/Arc/MetJ family transcriptional regulator